MSVSRKASNPIGIFDSGVGGLTVVREVWEQLPNESVVYFGDTARVPYGPKSPETVQRYAREATAFLLATLGAIGGLGLAALFEAVR